MSNHLVPAQPPPSGDLHPSVYVVIVGLTAWFVLSVWVLFGSRSYEEMTDGIITVFFIVAVGIPAAIWLTWRNHPEAHSDPAEHDRAPLPFGRWAASEFSTWTGGQKAWQAAIEILLPIAAVAFGITAFGLVYYFTSASTV
jgi:hypothetical protein